MPLVTAEKIHWKRYGTFGLALIAFLFLSLGSRAEERKVQKRVPPAYPELAKRMHIGGVVRIAATVAPDGTVKDVKTITGNRLLSRAAEDAVKQWRFVAEASDSTVTIDVSFDLGN
jgi:TonB family protein